MQYTDSNRAVVKLPERFDFGCVHDFRTCYENIDITKCKAIDIDFSDTKMMDSSALGMLINFKKFFDGQAAKVSITNCSSQIKKIFDISNFEKLFNFS